MNPGQAAVAVAERLIDPTVVTAAVPSHSAATLADGLPGTALLHARLSAVDPVFEEAARAHWDAAAVHAAHTPASGPGIHGTLGGLTASLLLGSPYLPDPDVTARTTARSVRWLSAQAVDLACSYDQSYRSAGSGVVWHVYDVISGLAGIGRILLAAVDQGHSSAEPGLLAALSAMTTMLIDQGGSRPGWWVATDQHPPVVAARLDPTGAADTGLAHGVAGPIAFLSLAQTAGYAVPGQVNAIRDAVDWLDRWRANGDGWPSEVSGLDLDEDVATPRPSRRVAWCYGSPGIARSLLLAARAVPDDDLAVRARADVACLAARHDAWAAQGPTLCHGYSGVLRCATAVDQPVTDHAATAVLQHLDPSRPFLFPHIEHGASHDNPGFLTGAAGVALALAEHGRLPAPAVRTSWDAALLIC